MTQLYKLTEQIRELNDLAEEPDMAEAVRDTLECLNMELNDKAINIVGLVLNRDTDIMAIDNEIKRLTARKKQILNFQNGLKDYLQINMEATNIKKIQCPLFTITLAAGRDIAIIDNAEDLADEFIKVTMTEAPIKADILKALKAGETVKGAHIEKSKSSIRIK